jgi:DNA-binding MarR family transcriptional regulator
MVAKLSGLLTPLMLTDVPEVDVTFGAEPPLARLLLLASRWFDARSLDELERRGWPRLTPAQSLVFAFLEEDGVSPAELARRLGHTRQATHQLLTGLCRLGLLDIRDDPARRGGRLVLLTERGLELAVTGYRVLRDLEEEFGSARATSLRGLLADFGSVPGAVLPH